MPQEQPPTLSLEGVTCSLRPMAAEDMSYLYDLLVSPQFASQSPNRGLVAQYDDSVQDLAADSLAPLVVVRRVDRARVGLTRVDRIDLRGGHARANVMISDTHAPQPRVRAEATSLFIRYLFAVMPFRKIYVEVPDALYTQITPSQSRYFTTEGCFRKHELFLGEYRDVHVLALYREMWMPQLGDVDRERQA